MSRKPSTARHAATSALVAFVSGWVLAALLPATNAPAAMTTTTTTFSAIGSAEQVYAVGLPPDAQTSLIRSGAQVDATLRADSLGGVLFRNVHPGGGYRVRIDAGGQQSAPVTVHPDAAAPWDPGIYDQSIPASGYGYLTTRDGTKLAIDVRLPFEKEATYPTVIEYAGYGYADPAGPDSGIALLARLMGFAVVDVNMRGTGCSGGAFDFFEPLQNLDGYDVIETVAHQPWVHGHKVGMVGVSYGAISQLFTAQLDPPDLEAISPLSTIDATASTLYPGGILNTGFAAGWAQGRQHDAEPAGPQSGQPWAYKRIQNGDATCAANQVLHGEAADLSAKIAANSHYNPAVADPLDPVSFVKKIKIPVFLACQWEDEQTGGQCPELVRHFTGTTKKWFTFTNGAHIDSLDPATFDQWYDFLELFVAQQAPQGNASRLHTLAPLIYQGAMGLPKSEQVQLPPDPIQQIPTYAAALAAFDKLPEVRVLFDNGAGQPAGVVASAGDPYAGFEHSFSTFPVPSTAQTCYFGPNGMLAAKPSERAGVDQYTSNARTVPLTDYSGTNTGTGGLWSKASAWQWDWQQNLAGSAVSYVTAPLATDTTVIGAGAVDLWVRSSTPDVDLQVTISEVRPDGNETFVQNGWLRASERALSPTADDYLGIPSTPDDPVPTLKADDAAPMPVGKFVKVVIPLYDEGHAYRAGSRIRVTISAPNGTQPAWSFSQIEPSSGTAIVRIAHSASMPSSLVLPVVAGVCVPTPLPACPSLRNEPCRHYQPMVNTGGTP